MRKQLVLVLISISVILVGVDKAECKSNLGIPDYMSKLVFEGKKFIEPIIICFPKEDDKKLLNEIRTTRYGIQPVFYMKGYQNIDKQVLSYLVVNNFAFTESAIVQHKYGAGKKYTFLFYKDQFKNLPNLIYGKDQYCLPAGRRVTKSIDYKNKYKGSPGGIEKTFYAITFSYVIEGSLPKLPTIDKVYKGKAKAFQDPDDGEWKLMSFELEDRREYEYLSQVKEKYAKYDPEIAYPAIENKYAENQIAKIAEDVALQCKNFLVKNPSLKKEQFNSNSEFKALALRKVGETGYTSISEMPGSDKAWRTWVHINPKLVGMDMKELERPLGEYFGIFWKIYTGVGPNKESSGYYKWIDRDGSTKVKYMVCVPIEGTSYFVTSTTYISEFKKEN